MLGNIMSRQVAGYVSRLRGLKTLGCFLSSSSRRGVLTAHYGRIWWHTQTDRGVLRGRQHVFPPTLIIQQICPLQCLLITQRMGD